MNKFVVLSIHILILVHLISGTVCAQKIESDCLFMLNHDGKNNHFDVAAQPGETESIVFSLRNTEDKQMTNYLLIYDALTAINGGNVIMTPENFQNMNVGAWFHFDCEEISLEAGGKTEKRLMFHVPADTPPGNYAAILGLYAKKDISSAKSNNESTEVRLQINNAFTSTLAVIIRVSGDIKREVGFGEKANVQIDTKSGKVFIYVPVENKGNSYEFPHIGIKIYNDEQILCYENTLKMDIVYCNTQAYASFELSESIVSYGRYRMEAKLKYGDNDTVETYDKEFVFIIDEKTARKAAVAELERLKKSEAGWKENYWVVGSRELAYAGGAILGVIVLAGIIILIVKKARQEGK